MCRTCGCAGEYAAVADTPAAADTSVADTSAADTSPAGAETLRLELDVLAKNDALAAANRTMLRERRVVAVNLMSAPGAGKTALLERTIPALAGEISCAVVEGDQETPLDAARILATGAAAVQVSTGTGCHLDAAVFARALVALDPPPGSLMFVENVGNLVCPALFDLGEDARVVLTSVPEGEDKPLKYPHMFRAADLVLLTKTDLLPHLRYDPDAFVTALRRVNPTARVLRVAPATGDGLGAWYAWLRARVSGGPGER
jgi:hydrogenase nickel incorporation protein HypB